MRKNYILLAVIFLTLACLLPLHGVFAADGGVCSEDSVLTNIVNILIKLLSTGWTVIAVLAGKLMSNEFVYASGFGLDKSLYMMWNYMKNIANFTLGFLLVYKIAKALFAKDAFSIKKELPNFLLASVLINMSWFVMGALLDVANVATAAVGSFPQTIVASNPEFAVNTEKLNVGIPDKMCLNLETGETECAGGYTINKDIDKIRGRFNDMSGPILYLGASIYRFQDYSFVNNKINSCKDLTIGMVMKMLILLMFVAPIIALFFINLQRIFLLWLWIVFAPIIVLLEVMKIKLDLGKLKDTFSFKEIIGMIFQPVFVIGGMAVVLILSVSMYFVMGGTGGADPGNQTVSKVFGTAEIINNAETSTFHNTAAGTEISYVGDIFNNVSSFAGGLVGYLIITGFIIMLLWSIVKMSTSSSKLASGTFNSVMKLGESLVGGLNIIPVGGGKMVSLASMANADKAVSNIGSQVTSKWKDISNDNIKSSFYNSALGKKMTSAYNLDQYGQSKEYDIAETEKTSFKTTIGPAGSLTGFTKLIAEFLNKTNKKKIGIKSREFKEIVADSLLSNPGFKQQLAKELSNGDEKQITTSALFDKNTDIGKRFMTFLQKNLQGDGTPVELNTIRGSNIATIGDDFTFYVDNNQTNNGKAGNKN